MEGNKMSTTFLRMAGTLIVAFGLIAGSFGVAMAGTAGSGIGAGGGNGGSGGNATVGGGGNSGGIGQDNVQNQNQDDISQGQGVGQTNAQGADQGSDLTDGAGGSVSANCDRTQPEGGEAGDGAGSDDSDASDGGDIPATVDGSDCEAGDSSVGGSSTGDSSQKSDSAQDVDNSSSQNLQLEAGSMTNAPEATLDQSTGNDANGGDGGDGGSGDNEGSVNVTGDLMLILIRILESILSGGDTIIEVDDDITLTEVCGEALAIFSDTDGDLGPDADDALVEVAIDAGFLDDGDDFLDLLDLCDIVPLD